MLAYTLRRLWQFIPTLAGVVLFVFFLFNWVGGDPAYLLAGKIPNPEMIANIPDKVKTRLLEQIPLKRFGAPEEVGRCVVYLVSPDGDYITGSELSINGGLLM